MPKKRSMTLASKPPAKTPKPTPPDPAAVEQVLRWMLSGARDADVLASIQAHYPGCHLNQLLMAAMDELAKSAAVESDIVFGFCIEATRDIHRRMLEIADYTGALRAIAQLADLVRKRPPPAAPPAKGGPK